MKISTVTLLETVTGVCLRENWCEEQEKQLEQLVNSPFYYGHAITIRPYLAREILKQHPQLETNYTGGPDWKEWLDGQLAIHGTELEITPLENFNFEEAQKLYWSMKYPY